MVRFRRRGESPLSYDAVLEAVGRAHDMGTYTDEVPLDAVVGSVARSAELGPGFRPRGRSDRLEGVRRQFDQGRYPPPIQLLRLGELFFVVDGHHRVAVARERNWASLPARVRRLCTVAYARCCLRASTLASSAAERRFVEQVPLPDEVHRANWLASPADWARLGDAAMAWGFRRQLRDGATYCCAADLAVAWWEQEVQPVVAQWRRAAADAGTPTDLPDLQVFVSALAHRDGLGQLDWSDPLNEQAPCH